VTSPNGMSSCLNHPCSYCAAGDMTVPPADPRIYPNPPPDPRRKLCSTERMCLRLRRVRCRAVRELARMAVAAVDEDDSEDVVEDDVVEDDGAEHDDQEHVENWPAIEALQDLWDAMEGEEGLTLTDGAKGYLAAVYVSHVVSP